MANLIDDISSDSLNAETIPFSFDEIYNELKNRLKRKGYDLSEGSNTSMLVDIMAYLVSMLNANTAVNINETLLAYANKTDNIIADARNLGYEIRKSTSYIYELNITVGPGTVIIPQYTQFEANGHNYYYIGEKLVFKDLPEAKEITIRVKEGTLYRSSENPETLEVTIGKTIIDNVETTQYYIDLPYTNIEDDGIFVQVSYYDENGIYHDHEVFTQADEMIYDVDSNHKNKYIRIDNNEYGTPRIYFKYANMGYGLPVGSKVYITLLETSGENGSAGDISDPKIFKCSIPGVAVSKVKLVQEGQPAESNESIKENAPKYYNSNNRLVTVNDYVAACERDARVKKAIVWGGEDEFPVSPGHIWFSFFPSTYTHTFTYDKDSDSWNRNDSTNIISYGSSNDELRTQQINFFTANYISNSEIRYKNYNSNGTLQAKGVWDKLDEIKVPTLEYHHRNPIYCEMSYTIEILKYLLTEDKDKIHEEIFTIIDNCFTGKNESVNFETFDTEYFLASIIKRIDKRITDISGFNIFQKNRLVLNSKTVCSEQVDSGCLDQYIPLAAPYEAYFDENGYLLIDKLPSIDTPDFISYMGEQGNDLYVDWSKIREDIANGIPQEEHKLIVAPVMCKQKDFKLITKDDIDKSRIQLKFKVHPDDCSQKEDKDFTYNGIKIKIFKDEVNDNEDGEIDLSCCTDLNNFTHSFYVDKKDPSIIHLSSDLNLKPGDEVKVDYDSCCGFYYVFNGVKRDILVHLFVDANESGFKNYMYGNTALSGTLSYLYTDDVMYLHTGGRDATPISEYYLTTEADINQKTSYIETYDTTPRSYLYTSDAMYMHSADSYYLTTNGYSVEDPNSVDIYTGSIVREINKLMYSRSPLKMDLFYRNRYLNLNYNSNNFALIKNVIPRLLKVKFNEVI